MEFSACACNCPVISVDVGDVQEVVGEVAGCRIVERSASCLADGIEQAFSHNARTDGRAKVERLEIRRIAKRVRTFYEHALAGRRTPP